MVSNLERYNGRFLCVKWSCSGNHSCSVEAEVYLKGLSCLLPAVIVVKAILVEKNMITFFVILFLPLLPVLVYVKLQFYTITDTLSARVFFM